MGWDSSMSNRKYGKATNHVGMGIQWVVMWQLHCWVKTNMYNSDSHHIKVPHSYLHKFSLCPSLTGLYHLSCYSTCSGKRSLRTPPHSLCMSHFTGNFNSASKNNRPRLFTVTEIWKKGIESEITYFSAKRLKKNNIWIVVHLQWDLPGINLPTTTYPLPNENSGCAVHPNDCVEAYICFCPQFSKVQLIVPHDFSNIS